MPVLKKVLRNVLREPLSKATPAPVYAPDLDLKFAEELRLDPRVDFSRGSNATVVDSDGTLKWAGHNLVTYSEFDSATPTNWAANFDTGTGSRTLGSSLYNLPTLTFEQTVSGRRHISQTLTFEANTAYKLVVFIDEAESFFTSGNQTVFAVTGLSDSTGTKNVRIQDSVSGVLTCSFTTGSDTSGFVQLGIGCFDDTIGKLVCSGVHLYKADKSMQQRTDVATGLETYYPTTSAAYYAPRFDHDPATNESLGLLIEESRTNLILASEDFSAGSWPSYDLTITTDQVASPDGTTNADQLTEGTGSVQPRATDTISGGIGTNQTYVTSCFFKDNDARYAYISLRSYNSSAAYAVFDLEDGVVHSTGDHGNSSFTSASMEDYGNGWYRCILISVSDTTDVSSSFVMVGITDSSTDPASGGYPTITGDGSSLYVWGAQLEDASFPTSYIPTSGSSVTRSADVADVPTSDFNFSATEGTLFIDCDLNYTSSFTFPRVLQLSSSSTETTDRISLFLYSTINNLRYAVFTGGVSQGANSLLSDTSGERIPNKVAFAYEEDNLAGVINGGSVVSDATADLPAIDKLSTLDIAGEPNSSFKPHINIRRIQYYARRLDDATLQALTQPSLEPSLNLVFDSSETSYVNTGLTR